MIAECIRLSEDKYISLPNIQEKLRERFGLSLPRHVIQRILSNAERENYITRVKSQNLLYQPNREKLAKLRFHQTHQDVLDKYKRLIFDLRRFCDTEYKLEWTTEEAESALQTYLSENQFFLLNVENREPLIPLPEQYVANARFIVGSYIKYLQTTGSPYFDYLVMIVKGNMLANSIYLPIDSPEVRKNWKTHVYFDTTFLIQALGYNGRALAEPRLELLQALAKANAILRCFRHNFDEIQSSLHLCRSILQRGNAYDDVRSPLLDSIEYFVSVGYDATDVELLIQNLEKNLRKLGVSVVDKPSFDQHKYVIDEQKLTDLLQSRMHYTKTESLDRDVASISAIARLRQGQSCYHVETCEAIFITTNDTLVKTVFEFFTNENRDPKTISYCLTDYTLTNLLWLRRPNESPNLPRKFVIADCWAAIQPSEDLWDSYLEKIEKLQKRGEVTTEDYYLFRYGQEARIALMEVTQGGIKPLTEGTIPEILDRAREIMSGNLLDEIEKKNDTITEKDTRIQELENKDVKRRKAIKARADKEAYRVARILTSIIFLLFVISLYLSLPESLFSSLVPNTSESSKNIFRFFFMSGLIISALSFKYGYLEIFKSIQKNISMRLEKLYLKIAQLD